MEKYARIIILILLHFLFSLFFRRQRNFILFDADENIFLPIYLSLHLSEHKFLFCIFWLLFFTYIVSDLAFSRTKYDVKFEICTFQCSVQTLLKLHFFSGNIFSKLWTIMQERFRSLLGVLYCILTWMGLPMMA
jgi:hypothetical protein